MNFFKKEKKEETAVQPESSVNFSELEAAAHAQQKIEHELTRWEAIKAYPKSAGWILFMVWTMILVGYENQASSIVVSIPQFRQDFGHYYNGEYVLAANWQSAISGAPMAALAVASFGSSWAGDRFGRKWVMWIAMLITIPAVSLEYIATTMNVFIAGKIVNALCLGVINTLAMAYVSEISPLALRGLAGGACSLSLCIGPFVCYLINNTTASYTTRMAYRGVFIGQYVFSVVCIIITPFMPESPYFYVRHEKNDAAEKALNRLFSPEQVPNQFAIIKVTYEELRMITTGASYAACFNKKNIKRSFLVMFSFFMQSMCGVTFVASYSTYYFQLAGYSTHKSYQFSCAGQSLSICGVITSWFILDRFGRRPLMLIGMSCLTLLNLIVACTGIPEHNAAALTTASAFLIMYNYFYNFAIGPLPYILSTEVSSVNLRAKTMALATITNYAFQCMWSFVLPYMFNPDQANMGSKIMFIFFGLSFLSLFVFYFFQPETAGRSFEEIDEMYDRNVPPRNWASYKTEKQQESDKFYDKLKHEVSHNEYAGSDASIQEEA